VRWREKLLAPIRSAFASLRNEQGPCKLATDALTGPYGDGELGASLPLRCERVTARDLEVTVDAAGKLTAILFRQATGQTRACD
jgi:hypothetical protein